VLSRQKGKLHLGELSVARGGSLVRRVEGLVAGAQLPRLDRALLDELSERLSLPDAASVATPSATDLAIDVVLESYRFGSASDLSVGSIGLPIYWRPKVKISVRLYCLQSGEEKSSFRFSQAMPWSDYLNRVLSWRVLLGLEPPAGRSDLQGLVRLASERLLARVETAV
jgi:hypothetical protein